MKPLRPPLSICILPESTPVVPLSFGYTLSIVRPAFELAQVLQTHWPTLTSSTYFNTYQLRTLDALRRCRSASLGGHIDACSDCGLMRISYNSCRNRHCPKCQNLQKEEWMLAR